MKRRGQKTFEEKIGIDRFKELTKRLKVEDIARLYCNHYVDDKDKEKCKSCKRTIYRAIKRVKQSDKTQRTFEPMANFRDIPEIQYFREFHKNRKDVEAMVNKLEEMWNWIKENPKLQQTARPALWNINHIAYIIDKVKKKQVSLYTPKEFLRRLYESMDSKLQKHKLIKAHRKDMRSPKGAKRYKTSFTPDRLSKIHDCLTDLEKLYVDLHITCKCREGSKKGKKVSLLGIQWKHINWEDTLYGEPMATVDVYESKTGGGTWWRHIPIDLWFFNLSRRLRTLWIKRGKPSKDYVVDIEYKDYLKIWKKISVHVGVKLEPHDCRRSPASWLRDLGLSDLALGEYNPSTGEAIGYAGVGWENSEIYYQRYGKMNPKAIYDKKLKLNTEVFTGSILKILENRSTKT